MNESFRARRDVWKRRDLLRLSGAAALVAACGPAASNLASATPSSAATASAGAAPRWGMTAAQDAAWRDVEAAAKKEGKVTYYSLGSVPANKVDVLKSSFAKDYPDIEVQYVAMGNGSELATRLSAEQDAKLYVADVFDRSVQFALGLAKYLAAFIPPASQDPSVKWLTNPIADPEGKGTVRAEFAQYVAIWYNTKLVKAADAPKNHTDLTNPKWKDQIIWRTPWETGAGSTTYIFAKQELGPDWPQKMKAVKPTFASDQDAALLQVARGEFAIGLGLTGRTGGQLMKDGQPIAAIFPNDFTVAVPLGTQLLATAPHPNAARVFANWMLMQRGQELWRDLGQFPQRADIAPAEPWMLPIKDVKKILSQAQVSDATQKAAMDEAKALFK
ncbi:MAG TPA: ABC transporter substrate-binding protein [Candidatus Limnocylindria bacterium]|nr:ABC transporter substrate-binding protein [Candidatus Limnocylindria bacterium]